jgi:hypothetical protein
MFQLWWFRAQMDFQKLQATLKKLSSFWQMKLSELKIELKQDEKKPRTAGFFLDF